MDKKPFIIRKWTDGERPTSRPGDAEEGTFVIPDMLATVDPGASTRYKQQVQNGTLRVHRIVSSAETDNQYGVFYVRFTQGSDFPNHLHRHSQASIMVIEGDGYVILDGERFPITVGDVVHIPPGTAHEFFVAREGEAFAYLSVTQPDVVLTEGDHAAIDWHTQPSNRYTPDGDLRDI